MTEDKKTLHKQLSRSGYPFQLRVEKAVLSTEQQHGWRVVTREQGWENPETNSAGFIDLLLQHGEMSTLRLVVECKRQRGDDPRALQWLFLIPKEEASEKDRVRCLSVEAWKSSSEPFNVMSAWDDVRVTPASLESQFCVLQSDEPRRQPILESLCSELLESIEGLAEEESNIVRADSSSYASVRAFYIPVVITNVQLRVCQFETDSISLTDGVIPEDTYQMMDVTFVRFRKSLAHAFQHDEQITNLEQANRARERT